ncbi:MAG: HlyD family efflux transporter periplasmic adaptor subunit [Lachnospirales bacterium]
MKKALILVLMMATLSSCSIKEDIVIEAVPKKVNTIVLEESEVQETSKYTGYLLANEVKKYSFTQGGQILNVNVKKGDVIKTGDVLAVLDSEQIQYGIDNAEATKNLAENESQQVIISIDSLNQSLDAEKIVLNQLNSLLESEKLNLETLENTYDKNITQLENEFNLLEDTYNKNLSLLENGIVSQNDFNQLETQYNNTKNELENLYKDKETYINLQKIAITNAEDNIEAEKIKIASIENQINSAKLTKTSADLQVNQAQIGVDGYESQLDDATLKATSDGVVIEVVSNEGEVTGAGTPVVVAKSNINIVTVGVNADDVYTIEINEKVSITFNDESYEGVVTSIASYPEETTKTYSVEVEVIDSNIPLGSLVNVGFNKGVTSGIFVPINAIINRDGINYVYVVSDDNIATKKEVTLGEIYMDKVKIEGLSPNSRLIVDGFNAIKENDIVSFE